MDTYLYLSKLQSEWTSLVLIIILFISVVTGSTDGVGKAYAEAVSIVL